ncbi:macrolide phosphotransferase [Georgenia satyanarayanai]|uniref:Macrolide phosphotransferase n=1 Tax=Georgenia satyanarayanai TaxID=860221 RepID=A0A2Y9C7G8_9MICO|nr:macrolide 2'-phosphotransferase [Georgenia satyanarayanai]PYF97803.1 macrolide phosphotransferase [Georgenia satyanarayanai]SSA45543.1 macrolide phosphotransferase [Georgenia satyanarayanai]
MGDDDLLAEAASRGLQLAPSTLRHNDAGLDFAVVYAQDVHGRRWVLRIPRRADVVEALAQEEAVLAFASRHLRVAVPEWRVRSRELIAYPLLPGHPGLTLEGDQVEWHVDPGSERYAAELGRLLADLHAAPLAEARELGIEVRTPEQVRESWRADVARVAREFAVDPQLLERYEAWLQDDGLWPEDTVFTHGELYPAHVLIDQREVVTGVLDWTTARGDDPARDFMYQHAFAPPEAFAATLRAYTAAGGRDWGPGLADRCAALMAAGPVGYGVYALTTGRAEHREAAQVQLAGL